MSNELAVIDHGAALVQLPDPEAEVEWAARCARALVKAISGNPQLKVQISGRDYVKVEGWQTLGAMTRVDQVDTVWCREYTPPGADAPIGWEARVEVRDQTGRVRGSGEAMCVRSENQWRNRDEYALRSMAQTRAMGKAYRMALSHLVALAGYQATPAEEMPGYGQTDPPAAAVAGGQQTAAGFTFPSGKHSGKPLADVPADYLDWYLANGPRDDVKDAIRAHQGIPPQQTIGDDEEIPF